MKRSVSLIFALANVANLSYSFIASGVDTDITTPSADEHLPLPCDSEIYCHGKLLHTIQMARIFKDSKTFVDMKMQYSVNDTISRFRAFMERHNDNPNRDDVKDFLDKHFESAGQEFEPWTPSDWTANPRILDRISDVHYRVWATKLNSVWKDLGRKMKDIVKIDSEMYSIIWVPNPVIVPGGRFREFYYWDSYWIVQGLLHSEMADTVRGMLDNFAYIVDIYGKIPNGGRKYYLNRSQPPLFLPMVKLYLDHTRDIDYLRQRISIFEREFAYWLREHVRVIEVNGKNYSMAFYGHDGVGPRPESYSEDVDTAKHLEDQKQKDVFYSELKAAAESGWDFSSRWFIKESSEKGNLTNTRTRSIVPVDLNSLLHWNAKLLSEWHSDLGNFDKSKYYKAIADAWLEAIEDVLWHEEVGVWLDYDSLNNNRRDNFYPSNLAPLWTRSYRSIDENRVRLVLKYLDNMNVIYPGGIPTSREHTGEQWDFPNAWPPLQHIIIVGLSQTNDSRAQSLAVKMAETWIQSNYQAFNETNAMFEKYDATVSGGHGGGGEYEVQLGFGWTNGIVLDLLHRFFSAEKWDTTGQQLSDDLGDQELTWAAGVRAASGVMTWLVALVATAVACYIGFHLHSSYVQSRDAKSSLSNNAGPEREAKPECARLKQGNNPWADR